MRGEWHADGWRVGADEVTISLSWLVGVSFGTLE